MIFYLNFVCGGVKKLRSEGVKTTALRERLIVFYQDFKKQRSAAEG